MEKTPRSGRTRIQNIDAGLPVRTRIASSQVFAGWTLPPGVVRVNVDCDPPSFSSDERVSREEFSRLIEQVLPALELYASQWSTEPADVVQEAFLRLWKQSPPPEDARAWLFRVVRNLSISQLRSARRRSRPEELDAIEEAGWFEQDVGQQIDAADVTRRLQELPEELREPVIAHVWGELTFHEIGELVGASSSTVHRRYQQAMEQLRTQLRPTCPSSPTPTAVPTAVPTT